jgi:hypothetical protein
MKQVTNLQDINNLFSGVDPEKVTDLVEGTDPDSGDDQEKTYKTMAKTSLVALIAYMLGMDDQKLEDHYGEYNADLLEDYRKSKEATIIRYLCRIRTSLMLNFLKVDKEMQFNVGNIDRMEYFNKEEINQLMKWEVPIILTNSRAEKYSEHVNDLIAKHIDACEALFPEWVKFEYVRDLFVVPKYKKAGVLKAEFDKYMANLNLYPFHMYMHWEPVEVGNLLYADNKFVQVLYEQHKDYFTDMTKLRDAAEDTKQSIYDFIEATQKITIVVDCENSDVYKLSGVLKNLDEEKLSKIDKIILYDDAHTTEGWDYLSKYTIIPVEHVEVERVSEYKSLVDLRMTAGICKAFYEQHMDSFILCSSDSDFWGVISELPAARFLVLYEYSKCGQAIKDKLNLKSIFHCAIDDFYTGNAEELKKLVLRKRLESELPSIIGQNAWDLTKRIYAEARIDARENEKKAFCDKYVKTLKLKLDENGEFFVEIQG